MTFEILKWDSTFFGIGVARITVPTLEVQDLRAILSALGAEGIRLVYWPSHEKRRDEEIDKLGGYLVDAKTTFFVDFRELDLTTFISTVAVEAYAPSMPIADLELLAIQSGAYSRYSVDPRIPREKFLELYKTWLKRSLNKEIADEVLVIREDDKVIGMVTLGEKNGKGDIGIIAVADRFRGRKYGEMLVRAAQQWFIKNGYTLGQVVTQGENRPAYKLYSKCGYSVEKVEYFYHFWLDSSSTDG